MPRAHNIHVMYNFEHHSSQVAAEWGDCVVIADVCQYCQERVTIDIIV